ncbi:hypothetical protein BHU72_12160 [Desulfuribacillus stibiiarsenatis]|uniref:Uncharacterized protein n=1 Tax=Desulfuribacillus stibiiarsenatis TaxID=1390249 RepID=A0A1E5L225_9FIRM|nr:hypothetical protein [Desulfuribacillus stibiiarsenatis]OEH84154.1 hypothetical protein BHU72_12160 [Desulfuribacillus stibiiarsenatis]
MNKIKILIICIIIIFSAGCTQNYPVKEFILSGESEDWSSELKVIGSELELKLKYKNGIQKLDSNELIEVQLHLLENEGHNGLNAANNKPTLVNKMLGTSFTLSLMEIKNDEITVHFRDDYFTSNEPVDIKLVIIWNQVEQTLLLQ